MAVVTPEAASNDDGVIGQQLIDTDVHEAPPVKADLMPYLAPVWQRHLTEYHSYMGGERLSVPTEYPYSVPQGARLEWTEGGELPGGSLEIMQRQLFEGEGVTKAVLNGLCHLSTMPGNHGYAGALLRAYNDWQIEHWLERESRLRGSIHVLAHDAGAAVKEIERLASHPQMVQVFLPTVSSHQYGDPMFWPIYEAAVKHDLVVAFHHGGNTRTLFGYPRTYLEWHTVSAPHAGQNQLLSVICNGVFERYPDLKTVFLEAGIGWVPWFLERLDDQFRSLRTVAPWLTTLPSDQIRSSVRFSTQPMADVKPKEFVRMVREHELEEVFMFSTDYPHYDADSADAVFPSSVPDDLQRRVRYQNAVDTYPRL